MLNKLFYMQRGSKDLAREQSLSSSFPGWQPETAPWRRLPCPCVTPPLHQSEELYLQQHQRGCRRPLLSVRHSWGQADQVRGGIWVCVRACVRACMHTHTSLATVFPTYKSKHFLDVWTCNLFCSEKFMVKLNKNGGPKNPEKADRLCALFTVTYFLQQTIQIICITSFMWV